MGNGSSHGKEAERTEKPPKGANIIGEDGKMMKFEPEVQDGEEQGTAETAKKAKPVGNA